MNSATPAHSEHERLLDWVAQARAGSAAAARSPFGASVARAGRAVVGAPFSGSVYDEYLDDGGDPAREPLSLPLDRFNCLSFVESCLAVARLAASDGAPSWEAFAREVERVRYRDGARRGYTSRLHYFSEWLSDNARRGILLDLGPRLGVPDPGTLDYITTRAERYPALRDPAVHAEMRRHEQRLAAIPRWVIPTRDLPRVEPLLEEGDVVGLVLAQEGLDVAHAGIVCTGPTGRPTLLSARQSAGEVLVDPQPLVEHVRIRDFYTGICVGRPTGR
ncbi:MAG TPA: N-acetylmuramoyl-L-alanine amidase-like domain-containing protein [Longimicrobiaceae bacterium]|nr:N-acetylmuramoyl-L-alanine amidase-like domain-containing protein [Longimicrobiaceae bacterium]